MAKVILLCGMLCAGKTTYAARLAKEVPAMHLSIDALMLRLFPEPLGAAYDEYLNRAQLYLCEQAAALARAGLCVVLEGNAWQRESRRATSAFFAAAGVPFEWHYLPVGERTQRERIAQRNREGGPGAYYVDEGLLEKCRARFEEPSQEEMGLFPANRNVRNDPEADCVDAI
ncbi:MAG: ATP-binding protein [Oscillospiraceae bacterium]|jgi:predicted kinase|nr:ATP-binding protein [Oscillospiraceae bacterium]